MSVRRRFLGVTILMALIAAILLSTSTANAQEKPAPKGGPAKAAPGHEKAPHMPPKAEPAPEKAPAMPPKRPQPPQGSLPHAGLHAMLRGFRDAAQTHAEPWKALPKPPLDKMLSLLSGNKPKILSDNEPNILSGNRTELFSGNTFSLFSNIKIEVEVHITNSGNHGPEPPHAAPRRPEPPRPASSRPGPPAPRR